MCAPDMVNMSALGDSIRHGLRFVRSCSHVKNDICIRVIINERHWSVDLVPQPLDDPIVKIDVVTRINKEALRSAQLGFVTVSSTEG